MAEKKRFYGGEDAALVGRALGALKRGEPEIYDAIMEFAERNNMSPVEAVMHLSKRSILLYRVEESGLTLKDLYIAWEVLRDFLQLSFRTYADAMKLFLSESSQALGQVIQERVNEALKEHQAKPDKADRLKAKLVDFLADMMEATMRAAMRQMFKMMGCEPPESLKLKIPVELREEAAENG